MTLGVILWVMIFPAPSTPALAAIDVQAFRAAHNSNFALLETYGFTTSATPTGSSNSWLRYGPLITAQIHTVSNPLVLTDAFGTTTTSVVDRLTTMDIGLSGFLSDTWQLGLDFSLSAVSLPSQSSMFGLGDTRLISKHTLSSLSAPISLGIAPQVFVPTGNTSLYLSNGVFGLGVETSGGLHLGPLGLVGTVGYHFFYGARYSNLDFSHQVKLGVGADIAIGRSFSVSGELITRLLPANGFQFGPGDFYVGTSTKVFNGGRLLAGIGVAPVSQSTAASFRILAGLRVYPAEPEDKERVVVVNTLQDCGIHPFSNTYYARRLTPEEFNNKKLYPYRGTADHPLPILQLGEMTGLTPGGTPFVEASQVVFAVDLVGLPSRDTIVSVDTVSMAMEVKEVSSNNSVDTEILCFLNEKICSGELYRAQSWLKNINPDFFDAKETPNDHFVRQYAVKEIGRVGNKKILAGDITLSFEKLLENVPDIDLLSLLYGKAGTNSGKRTLYFVVADDTFVSTNVRVSVVLKENSCRPPPRQ